MPFSMDDIQQQPRKRQRQTEEMHFECWCWRQFFNIFIHYFIAYYIESVGEWHFSGRLSFPSSLNTNEQTTTSTTEVLVVHLRMADAWCCSSSFSTRECVFKYSMGTFLNSVTFGFWPQTGMHYCSMREPKISRNTRRRHTVSIHHVENEVSERSSGKIEWKETGSEYARARKYCSVSLRQNTMHLRLFT